MLEKKKKKAPAAKTLLIEQSALTQIFYDAFEFGRMQLVFKMLASTIFFFNDTATTEIYTLSYTLPYTTLFRSLDGDVVLGEVGPLGGSATVEKLATKDRKSTRLNSSHIQKSRMPSSA